MTTDCGSDLFSLVRWSRMKDWVNLIDNYGTAYIHSIIDSTPTPFKTSIPELSPDAHIPCTYKYSTIVL